MICSWWVSVQVTRARPAAPRRRDRRGAGARADPLFVRRFGHGPVVVAGLVVAAAAYAVLLPLTADRSVAVLVPALVLLGVAFALAYGPLTLAGTEPVDDAEQGLASGLMTMSFQFGGTSGLAVVTAVVVAATDSPDPAAVLAGYRAGLVVPLVAAPVGVLLTLPLARRPVAR
jgi:hypothetical protein